MLTSNLKLLEEKNPLLALQVNMARSSLEETEVTYVYGVGEVPFKGHRLIFFENDLERLHQFLHLETAERLLKDPRVHFYGTDRESLKKGLWETALLSYQIIPLKKEGFQSFKDELESLREGIFLSICDVRDKGRLVLSNVIENSSLPCLDGLSLSMKGIPAIVCGSGPSLEVHREWVKTYAKKALILACGSAMELLEEAHAGVCLDPAQPQNGYDRPLFYQNRVSHHFLQKVKGPLLNMGHSGGFPVDVLFFGEERYFDAGWNAGNFGVAVAKALGCSPIVTVGIDHEGGYVSSIKKEKGTLDFKMGREWMEDQPLTPLTEVHFPENQIEISFKAPPLIPLFSKEGWQESWDRSGQYIKSLLETGNPLYEIELEEEVVYKYHLAPLWMIWQHLTSDKWLFFALVLEERF
jgi:hypothetical protein